MAKRDQGCWGIGSSMSYQQAGFQGPWLGHRQYMILQLDAHRQTCSATRIYPIADDMYAGFQGD